MTGLCLVAGLLVAQFGDDITLRWTHSIQKIVWEEDYRREGGALRLVEARVRGTGAGMEPPANAVLREGAWHYTPTLPPLPRGLRVIVDGSGDRVDCASRDDRRAVSCSGLRSSQLTARRSSLEMGVAIVKSG